MAGFSDIKEPGLLSVGISLYWERLRSRLQTGPLWRMRFVGPVPDRVLYSPSCLRPSDPLVARDIYQARFTFSGRTVDAGSASVFTVQPPSPAWENDLHRFAWLRHLEHAGSELAAENGRALIDEWIAEFGRRIGGVTWEPAVCAARVIAWIQHARFVLQNSEHGFYRRYMSSLARQVRYLRSIAPGCDDNIDLLHVRIALALASLTLPSSVGVQKRAAANLEEQLRLQILPDGGHISRNPNALPDILVNLLPLSQIYVADSKPVPPELLRAVDRMFPRLRFFRHADGNMAEFHGGGGGRAELAAAILRNDTTNGAAGEVATQSGYYRLEQEGCVVIADTGQPVRGADGQDNHASALAFEFSSGRSRLVVNAGNDRLKRDKYDAPARATAAHSTLTLDDHSSAVFHKFHVGSARLTRLLAGPSRVETQPWDTNEGHGFSARHDGYLKSTGLWHERGILLAKNGLRISGYDRLTPHSTVHHGVHRADVRFHLHPSVQVKAYAEAEALELTNDRGEVWRFTAVSATPQIEESIYLAGITGPVYNKQIVLSFAYPDQDNVQWRFERLPG